MSIKNDMDKKDLARIEKKVDEAVKASLSTQLSEMKIQLNGAISKIEEIHKFFIDGDDRLRVVPVLTRLAKAEEDLAKLKNDIDDNHIVARVDEMYEKFRDFVGSYRVGGVLYGIILALVGIISWLLSSRYG